MRAAARAALQRIGFDLDVTRAVETYSVAEQQAVELAKALRKKARVLCWMSRPRPCRNPT